MRIGTAMASRISHQMAKLGCAREWGGWGRLSDDGPGQHNPDRSEGPWGRAGWSARTEVPNRASSLTQGREYTVKAWDYFRLARHPPAMGRSGVCTLRIPAAYASRRSFPPPQCRQ